MITYQDFERVRENETDLVEFIRKAINEHRGSDDYKIAEAADEYAAQSGKNVEDILKEFNKRKQVNTTPVVSDLFYRLNVQRVAYSLGNGITFSAVETKKKLGKKADNVLFDAGYHALIHKYAVLFMNFDKIEMFKLTEFVPLLDMYTGELRAGIRFWQLEDGMPVNVTLYEAEGFSKFESESGYNDFKKTQERKPYITHYTKTEAFGEKETGGENYESFPFVVLYGSRKKQSTLVGLRSKLDMYDVIQSGFARDVATAAQVIWLFENAGGMEGNDFEEFTNNLFAYSAANVNTALDGAKVQPHQFRIDTQAHESCLEDLRASIYEDFGALDVHTISASATNDHIDAAYLPVDLVADDFEYQVIEAVEKLLALVGVEGEEATPIFSRNKISNQYEYTQMLMLAAQYLDEETMVKKLPFLTPDETEDVLDRMAENDLERFGMGDDLDTTDDEAEMDNKYLGEFSDEILKQLESLMAED